MRRWRAASCRLDAYLDQFNREHSRRDDVDEDRDRPGGNQRRLSNHMGGSMNDSPVPRWGTLVKSSSVVCGLAVAASLALAAPARAPANDMVAEPFQGVSIHVGIVTRQGGNVESPCPFRSVNCMKKWKSLPRDARQIGPDLRNPVPGGLFYFLLGQPDHLHPGPGSVGGWTFSVTGPDMAPSDKPWDTVEGNQWKFIPSFAVLALCATSSEEKYAR